MRKTNVKEHARQTKKGRTRVRRHKRNNFRRRKVNFKKLKYKSSKEIEREYLRAEYRKPHPGMTNPKGSDFEMVLAIDDNKREHHRVWEESDKFILESHIDQADPMKNPGGHVIIDVIEPELDKKKRINNFNDTQKIELEKE